MGKQILKTEEVELIKHLHKTQKLKCGEIGRFFNISRENVSHILNKRRWKEVTEPDEFRGEYLLYKYTHNFPML